MFAGVRLNHAGMSDLLNSPGVGADMLRRAQAVASVAQDGAPVRTGAYRGSIHAELATTDRAVGRVVSDSLYALLVEFHTRNLGRAIDAAR